MDRFLCGLALCMCLCFAPVSCAREDVEPAYAQPRKERALFSVLYPRLLGLPEGMEEATGEGVEWYSIIAAFLRGELA